MKFIYKKKALFFGPFGVFFIGLSLLPTQVFSTVLANNLSQQHFTDSITYGGCPSTTSNWSVCSSAGTYVLKTGSAIPDVINGNADVSSQYVTLYGTTPATGAAITVTYTEPASPGPNGTGGLVEMDLYADVGASIASPAINVVDTTTSPAPVTASSGASAADILPYPDGCWYSGSNPTAQGIVNGKKWETIFQDASGLSNPVSFVQLVFVDTTGSMTAASNWILLDNLRGQPLESCFTATNTSTPGPNTPTCTATATATQTSTNTKTQTPTPQNTNTVTNTPSFTPTLTSTSTPGITQTPTMTMTATAGACQPYVYPNPMDFTINHNLAYGANGYCDNGNGQCVVFNCIPVGSTMKIYTVSLALVREFPTTAIQIPAGLAPGTGMIVWDGSVSGNLYVASGLYFYVINGPNGNTFGKFAISKSIHGP